MVPINGNPRNQSNKRNKLYATFALISALAFLHKKAVFPQIFEISQFCALINGHFCIKKRIFSLFRQPNRERERFLCFFPIPRRETFHLFSSQQRKQTFLSFSPSQRERHFHFFPLPAKKIYIYSLFSQPRREKLLLFPPSQENRHFIGF